MQFSDVTVEWTPSTLLFYMAIIMVTYLVAIAFQRKSIKLNNKRYSVSLMIVTFIFLLVKCFNTTGRDLRSGYYYNYLSATSMSAYHDQTVEPGFRLLMVLFRNINANYGVFLFVVGLMTVLPVIHYIDKYKDRIDVPSAVLIYTCLYYFNSFSAYRQYMAVSLSLIVLDAIIEAKPIKALVWIVIAASIHTSCLILAVPYFLCFVRLLTKRMIAFSIIAFFTVALIGRNVIISYLAASDRYYIYSVANEINIGLEQIIYYSPLFYIIYECKRYKPEKNISRIAFVYLSIGFLCGMLSYIIPIFGRMSAVFLPIILLIPYYIMLYKKNNKKPKQAAIYFITFLYCVARFFIWIIQYFSLEDLMPYTNVFGVII